MIIERVMYCIRKLELVSQATLETRFRALATSGANFWIKNPHSKNLWRTASNNYGFLFRFRIKVIYSKYIGSGVINRQNGQGKLSRAIEIIINNWQWYFSSLRKFSNYSILFIEQSNARSRIGNISTCWWNKRCYKVSIIFAYIIICVYIE